MSIDPLLGGFFTAADLVTNSSIKNFGAAAGHGAQAGITQNLERLADRQLEYPLGQMPNLDCGKRFDVKVGIESAQIPEQVEVPLFSKRGMQTSDHVHFGNSQAQSVSNRRYNFFRRVFKSMSITLFGRKGD